MKKNTLEMSQVNWCYHCQKPVEGTEWDLELHLWKNHKTTVNEDLNIVKAQKLERERELINQIKEDVMTGLKIWAGFNLIFRRPKNWDWITRLVLVTQGYFILRKRSKDKKNEVR